MLDHKRALLMLDYCFFLDQTDIWLGAVQVLRARLTPSERAALAYVSQMSQDAPNAALTAQAIGGHPGTPLSPFMSAMDEAAFWADIADLTYIKAVVLASYNRMPSQDQAAFLDYVHGKKAA